MGFYGNITNTNRTTFQFDKIYSSRYTMDGQSSSDGVYNGRYVLVEYDSDIDQTFYKTSYVLVGSDYNRRPYKIYHSLKYKEDDSPSNEPSNENMFVYTNNYENTDFYNYFNGVLKSTAFNAENISSWEQKVLYFEAGQVYNIDNWDEMLFVGFDPQSGHYRELDFQEFLELNKNYWDIGSNGYNYFNNGWAATIEDEARFKEFQESDFLDKSSTPGIYCYLGYISNGLCHVRKEDQVLLHSDAEEVPAIILPQRKYTYNTAPQFWIIGDETFEEDEISYPYISAISAMEDNYSYNFNLDQKAYHTSRGYDSTVWQKVFVNGIEKYVMIAELNTVVPTFGITADPPSLLPLNPHWGADSTNVYYDLHWQPSWGLRIKAAESTLMTPIIDDDGGLVQDNQYIGESPGRVSIRDRQKDSIDYPSDVDISYSQAFEDLDETNPKKVILYYNANTSIWEDNNRLKLPGAIYFNKDGFNSETIAYSQDLTDRVNDEKHHRYNRKIALSGWFPNDIISVTPTGLSGNIYNEHNGSAVKRAQADTQEISIMLPGIGDMVSEIWDLIYGGRETSDTIKETNRRNKDISWENGPTHLYRLGLRLRGTDGKSYNPNAVETLAGCINTAHDLFGMIIQEYNNYNNLLANVENLSTNRIYYTADTKKYYRRHTNYEYTAYDDRSLDPSVHDYHSYLNNSDYKWEAIDTDVEYLTTDKINNGNYWVLEGNEYINVQDLDPQYQEYNPNRTYYYRTVNPSYTEFILNTGQQFVSFPYQDFLWYKNENGDLGNDPYYANYIQDPQYQQGKQYYKIVAEGPQSLIGEYMSDRYYYFDGGGLPTYETKGSLLLDRGDTPHNYILANHDKQGFARVPGRIYNGNFYVYDNVLKNYRLCTPELDGAYDASQNYYYKNTAGFYEVDASQMNMNLENVGFNAIYVPGQWYYLSKKNLTDDPPEPGDYVLDNSPNGSNITSEWNYDTETLSNGKVIHYCYPTMLAKEGYEEGQPILIYVLKHSFEVANYVRASNYSRGSYYIDLNPEKDGNNQYIIPHTEGSNGYYTNANNFELSYDDFDSEVTYYIDNKFYDLQEISDQSQMVDPGTKTSFEALLPYRDDTYYHKIYDVDDPTKITKFEAINYAWIQQNGASMRDAIYVLGTYPENAQIDAEYGAYGTPYSESLEDEEQQYYENDDRSFNWQNSSRGDGVIYISMKDKIAMDAYKIKRYPGFKPFIRQADNFYAKNMYHYLDQSNGNLPGSYILDKRDYYDNSVDHYIIKQITPSPDLIYVESDEYYYYANPQYIRLTRENINYQDHGIYLKDGPYVYEDLGTNRDDRLTMGMEWNVEAKVIPNDIVLGKRRKYYDLIEMEDYAIDKSTINGLLLDIYNKMEFNDTYTRDQEIMSGSLNKINDIIARFSRIKSRELTMVDDAGRVHSAPVLTQQGISSSQNNPGTDPYYNYIRGDIYPTVNDIASMRKQWITVDIDGSLDTPQIIIHHNFQGVTNTTSTSNKNTDNVTSNNISDKLNLYTPIVDAMGHVVGNNTETVTLPYGFKTIATNGVGSNTTNMETATTNIVAETTQDTLTINSDNEWIRLATDATNDAITIAHEIHSIDAVDATSLDFNDANSGETFTVTDISQDIAGHITANKNHTYTLPKNWKIIATNGSSNAVTDLTSNTTSVIADNCKDTLNINTANKWIKLAGDDTNNILQIGHVVNAITTTAKSDSDLDGVGEFTVQDITYDEAGHLTAVQNHKYELPHAFRNIQVTDNTTLNSAALIVLGANSYNDTVKIAATDNWLILSTNDSNQTINITHRGAQTATTLIGDSAAQTPQFAGTFKVPYVGIDDKGHVSTLTEHTITIPTITISTSATGNVVTGGGFNNDGTLTLNTTNLGSLLLNGTYTKANANSAITATDSLNSALGKLEYKVDTALTDISGLNTVYQTIEDPEDPYAVISDLEDYITNDETFSYDSTINADDNFTISQSISKIALLENAIVTLINNDQNLSSTDKQDLLDSLGIATS